MMKYGCIALAIAFSTATFTIGLNDGPRVTAEEGPAAAGIEAPRAILHPSLAVARRQAEILHAAMHATLQVVHHRYYQEDEGMPIPAAALSDVFAELEEELHIKLRWLVPQPENGVP